ncbi:MAG: hypothetical protein IKJ70_05735, partial [Clostridia bacterium]|nr:hypothetical protein [Clostridia bacterium]
ALNVRFTAPLMIFLLARREYCFVEEILKCTITRAFKVLRSLTGEDFYCNKAKNAERLVPFKAF